MEKKPVSYSQTTITELMIPSYANFSGKIHGGILLSLMDKVAFACGSKHSSAYCVTVSVEGVEFIQPVEVGELVSLNGSVIYVGKTSMIIGIHIEAMNPKTGETKHTNSCYFTMVAKDDEGNKIQVPLLEIEDQEQLKRFVEGMALKKLSRKKRKLFDVNVEAYSKENLIKACNNERCDLSLVS